MAIVYKSAELFVDGVSFTAALHELTSTYTAEMLDASVFGLNTRKYQGGLTKATISGKAWVDSSVQVDNIIFADIGVDDTQFLIFPDGVTDGESSVGFAMKGIFEKFDIGGTIGVLLGITFSAQTRGIEAS